MHYSSMQKQAANNHQPIAIAAPPTPVLLEITFKIYKRRFANYILPYIIKICYISLPLRMVVVTFRFEFINVAGKPEFGLVIR